ncbi:MAG TPA: hypothetical protein VJT74_14650 [Pyrinomonadaceae bacterium]|nr:hypothetical protein [Pyrinomonadaceae bacterium]
MEDYVKPVYSEELKHSVRGAKVSKGNTIIASGVLKWSSQGVTKSTKFPAVTSGNPMHKSKDVLRPGGKSATYAPQRLYENYKETDTGVHSDCAEQKIVRQARQALDGITYYEGDEPSPTLTIYSEKTPCSVCEGKIQALCDEYINLDIIVEAEAKYKDKTYGSTWWYTRGGGLLKRSLAKQQATGKVAGIKVQKPKPKPKQTTAPQSTNMFALLGEM